MTFTNIPKGTYQVFLYVWEDNDSETFRVRLDDREVLHDFASGGAGSWKRLGPWRVSSDSGAIKLTTRGGAANLSGVEIWKGSAAVPDPASGTPDPVALAPRDPVAVKAFDEKVAPILARNCLECHGGSIRKGGLNLATEGAARAGGDSGDPIEPGKPRGEPALGADRIGRDAEGPAETDRCGEGGHQALDRRRQRRGGRPRSTRSSRPPIAAPVTIGGRCSRSNGPLSPRSRPTSWPRNDIDRFVLAKLESKGLAPSAEADRRTLIRRLSFDLIGLPPEPEEVERFVEDKDPSAYEKLVDRLLDSPHYGERWARHWLDVVRFGESQGYERNRIRENAWRYRDWVIDSFNRDRPYDEFMRLQIAGDVLQSEGLRLADRHGLPRLRHLGPGGAQRRVGGDEEGDAVGRDGGPRRHVRPDVPRPLDPVCPLPRPQVRPDHAEGVLPGRRPLRGHESGGEGAGGHPADRDRAGEVLRRRACPDPPTTAPVRAAGSRRSPQAPRRGRARRR